MHGTACPERPVALAGAPHDQDGRIGPTSVFDFSAASASACFGKVPASSWSFVKRRWPSTSSSSSIGSFVCSLIVTSVVGCVPVQHPASSRPSPVAPATPVVCAPAHNDWCAPGDVNAYRGAHQSGGLIVRDEP